MATFPSNYYNRFDKTDKYKQLVYRAGFGLQSAELNEQHSYIHNELEQLAMSLYNDGSVINGGSSVFNQTTGDFSIASCKAFARGYTHEIAKTDFSIGGSETVKIGIVITESIISENEDATLRDPAINGRNFNEPGAHRLKVDARWDKEGNVVTGEFFYPVHDFQSGTYTSHGTTDIVDVPQAVEDFVGRTINDTHGSFLRNGLQTLFEQNVTIDDELYHVLRVTAGKAYVDGYETTFPYDQRVNVKVATSFKTVNNEPFTVDESKLESEDPWYETRWSPIKDVSEVNGIVRKRVDITHGSFVGASDLLPNTPVTDIVAVTQGNANAATGDLDSRILITANAGTAGNVAVKVLATTDSGKYGTAELSPGLDKIFVWIEDGVTTEGAMATAIAGLSIIDTAVADTPAGTWTLGVGTDTVTMSGGTATTTYTEGADFTQDGDYVNWSPAGSEPATDSTYTVVFEHQEVISPVISGDLTKIKAGTFIDGTLFYADYTFYIPRYDRLIVNSQSEFVTLQGAPNFRNPAPPLNKSGLSIALIYIEYGSDPVITLDRQKAYNESSITALFADVEEMKANVAELFLRASIDDSDSTTKKGMLVDSFLNDDQRDAGITQNAVVADGVLSPGISWTNTTLNTGDMITLDSTDVDAVTQTAITGTRVINELNVQTWAPAVITVEPGTYRWFTEEIYEKVREDVWYTNSSSYTTGIGGQYSIEEEVELGSDVTIPQITLSIEGAQFSDSENIEVYFDDTLVHTATATAQGRLSDNFTLPADVPSGTKSVRVVGETSGVTGEATFTATPVQKTISEVTTYVHWDPCLSMDPLAQTFAVPETMDISAISLYFETLPDTHIDIMITGTLVGFPDTNSTLAIKRIFREDITTGQYTKCVFDHPVRVEAGSEYAFVVLCNDDNASIKYAAMGDYDTANGEYLSAQPYGVGVLFQSSNASTWSEFQAEDLTFKIHRNNYSLSRSLDLTPAPIAVTDITDYLILTGTDIDPNTHAEFRIGFPDLVPAEELSVQPYTVVNNEKYTGDITVDLDLTSEDGLLTPKVDGDIILSLGQVQFPSTYITKNWSISGDTLKVILDVAEESNSSVKVFFQEADDSYTELTRGSGTQIDETWVEVPFSSSAGAMTALSDTRIKIVLDSTNTEQRPQARDLRGYLI